MTESPHQHSASARARALDGLRVLDVTQFMAGPVLLDDPRGPWRRCHQDRTAVRRLDAADGRRVGTESPSFNAVNRGKRSLVLNLKTRMASELFKRLVRSSDILIENYRPGVMQALRARLRRVGGDQSRV